jgi:hypothetical protein
VALRLIPGLLRERGVPGVTVQRLHEALASGAIPGRLEHNRWLVEEGDLGAVEVHFRGQAASRSGPPRKGAAAVEQARATSATR